MTPLMARPGDGYATRHNPFVYYHSLLDLGDCDQNDGPLDKLEAGSRRDQVDTEPVLHRAEPLQ